MKEDELPKLSRNPALYFGLPIYLIIGSIVLAVIIYKHHQIKLDGVKTYARVTELYNQANKKSTQRFVTITYACTGKACNSPNYVHDIDDTNRLYAIGDTVIIKYSQASPTIVEVIGTRRNGIDRINSSNKWRPG